MNRILSFTVVMSLALALLSACASRAPNAIAVPPSGGTTSSDQCTKMSYQAPSNEQSAPTTNSIRILTITPLAGSNVQKSTVLVADLAYAVRDFDSGKYIVIAQFDTNTKGKSTDGTFNSYPFLKYANGSFRLCFPLTDIWNAPDLQRPLSVRFLLNRIDDARHNHAIAFTDRIFFSTN